MEKKGMISRTFASAALVLMGLGVGCDPSGTAPTTDSVAPGGAEPTMTNASGTASASAAAPLHPQTGHWAAEFKAVRGDISIPRGVPYKWWDGDDGVAATGMGKVLLEISREGAVTGSAEGALGQLVVRGAIEDGTLRAGLFPFPSPDKPSTDKPTADEPTADEPTAEGGEAMSGVLVGVVVGDAIEGELRVSSHDAALVRHADVRLSQVR